MCWFWRKLPVPGGARRFGIQNAWRGEAAFWGSVSVGIDRLAAFNEADVICFDHGNEREMAQLMATPLWQAMPFVRAGRFQRVPAVWFYGATLSAMHFARVLADAREAGMNARISPLAILLLTGLLVAAFALSIVNLNVALPAQWRQALWQPDIDNIAQMLFHYSLLPRLAISLLVGAGLGLVGVLFQQVLRNPLAEPTTLGVATGAQLGMTVTTLWAIPGVLASQFAALAGACLVGALVFGVSWGKRLSPVTLILAGLVVSLYCGALNQLMVIFHHDQLQSMFLWSTGTLTQTDWSVVQRLWPQLLGGAILTLLLLRPLTLMGLDDGVARNLGWRCLWRAWRADAGDRHQRAAGERGRDYRLYRPVRAAAGENARRPSTAAAPAAGGADWRADPVAFDQIILWLSRVWREVSTGSVTALIGAPLLLWLLPRLRSISAPVMNGGDKVLAERHHVRGLRWAACDAAAGAPVALAFGRDAHGWHWASGDLLEQLMPWRWPRVLSALFAGVMLAVAGCIIQRLTGNPMASRKCWASALARRLAWC
jgi:iron complex transport system permease protein